MSPDRPSAGRDALVRRLRAAGCVFADQEADLLIEAAGEGGPGDGDGGALERLVARRLAGDPLEQVLGWAEFKGLRIRVSPGVFVPRRRSVLLVDVALRSLAPGAVVVDLCCGSGAVAAAIGAAAEVELYAADIDPRAVACARANLAARGTVLRGDLFAALPDRLRGRIDVVVANAPYVPTAALGSMPVEARDHEPRHALDGGTDGLDLHRRIAADAAGWLAPGGRLLIEVATEQVATAAALMTAGGLVPEIVTDADVDATVVVGGRRLRQTGPVSADSAAAARAAAVLRAAGLRATAPRIAVLRVLLAAAEDHLSAEEVHERAAALDASIHRATVYRTLEQLRRDGLVQHVHLDRGVAAFHVTDAGRLATHLHAQCTRCGRVVDLPSAALGRSAERVRATTGFHLDLTHVALSGLCAECAAAR